MRPAMKLVLSGAPSFVTPKKQNCLGTQEFLEQPLRPSLKIAVFYSAFGVQGLKIHAFYDVFGSNGFPPKHKTAWHRDEMSDPPVTKKNLICTRSLDLPAPQKKNRTPRVPPKNPPKAKSSRPKAKARFKAATRRVGGFLGPCRAPTPLKKVPRSLEAWRALTKMFVGRPRAFGAQETGLGGLARPTKPVCFVLGEPCSRAQKNVVVVVVVAAVVCPGGPQSADPACGCFKPGLGLWP